MGNKRIPLFWGLLRLEKGNDLEAPAPLFYLNAVDFHTAEVKE